MSEKLVGAKQEKIADIGERGTGAWLTSRNFFSSALL
jgi:hypothetical protein